MIGHGETCSSGWLCSDCQEKSQAEQEERARIVGIIQGRIDTHSRFVEFCMENDVRVTPSIFSSLMELRSLLRKIQEESK